MWPVAFWLYLANATLLLVHEIDSAYWKEWELFRLPGGVGGFCLIHVPLTALVLYGQALLAQRERAGLLFAVVLAVGGLFACAVHFTFLAKGRPEFRAPVSVAILVSSGLVSIALFVAVALLTTS